MLLSFAILKLNHVNHPANYDTLSDPTQVTSIEFDSQISDEKCNVSQCNFTCLHYRYLKSSCHNLERLKLEDLYANFTALSTEVAKYAPTVIEHVQPSLDMWLNSMSLIADTFG